MSEEEIIKEINMLIRFNEQDEKIAYSDFELMPNRKSYQALKGLLYLYNKEKEKNKELKEQLRKANEYIRNEMYIDDNPTICGDEEDTIIELPISLNLYNESLRELLELLEERN